MPGDLHLHSIYSDGSLTPQELIALAVEKGLSAVAITDHDTVEGTAEALEAGKEAGIEVIPAIEFSTFSGEAEIHILGYFIDFRSDELLSTVEKIFAARVARAKKMVKKLQEMDIEISYKQVKKLAGDNYVGRPHIARALVEQGYVKEIGDAFTAEYIGNDGRAYVDKYRIIPEEAIDLIRKAGGISVLAHPVFVNHGSPLKYEEIKRFRDSGLEGLEVYHSRHNDEAVDYYKRVAEELGLLITGGSDYHGDNSPDIELGDILLPDRYITRLRDRAKARK
ncbi:MAG: PHP domain-containing protein [Halanaerobiaceae bacterium]